MKSIRLTFFSISIGLLSSHFLFAQNADDIGGWRQKIESENCPIAKAFQKYSNISSYAENSNFSPISNLASFIYPIDFRANLVPEMQMNTGIIKGVEEVLGIEGFRKAIVDHPTAERLVIHREGGTISLRPREALSNNTKAVTCSENKEIIDQLRTVLPPEFGNDPLLNYQIPSNNSGVSIGVDPLSAERLREILNKLDTNQKTWNPLLSAVKGVGNILGVRQKRESFSQINETGAIIADSSLVTDQAKAASQEKMRLSEECVKEIESEESDDIKQLKILQKDFEASKAARKTAQDMLLLSQAQVEQASKNKIDMEKQLVKENEELNILKKKCRDLCGVARKMEFDDEGNPIDESKQAYNKQRIVVRMQTALPNAKNIFEEAKQRLEIHKAVAVAAEKEDLLRTKAYFDQGKIVLSKIDRATACAIADREEGSAVLPVTTNAITSANNCREISENETIKFLRKALEEELIIKPSNGKNSEIETTVFEGKTIEGKQEALSFNKVADAVLPSVDQLKKAPEAECQKNEREGDHLGEGCFEEKNSIAYLTSKSVDQLNQAATSLEQVTEAEKNGSKAIATLWRKSVEQNKVAAMYYQKAAEEYLSGNKIVNCHEKSRLYQAADLAEEGANKLKDAAESLSKAVVAEHNNNKPLARIWRNIAEQKQIAAECYRKATEICVSGDKNESIRCSNNGCNANWNAYWLGIAVESLEKAAEAAKNGNNSISNLWQKIAEQNLMEAECHQNITKAIESGNSNEVKCLKEANTVVQSSIEQFKKAIESTEKATKNERLNKLSPDIQKTGWRSYFNLSSQYTKKAHEAEKNENETLANLWQKIAEQNQVAAEFYKKAATAYMQQNETEAERCVKDAKSTESNIDRLKRAAKALEEVILYAKETTEVKISNSQPISDLWRKTAEQYQFLFEHHRKAAEAQMRGNKEEITRFNKADWSIRFSAEQLEAAVACTEEAIQAGRSRNQGISDLWIKTAEQYQVAAEYERKNAEADMLDNKQEKKRWQEASAFARYSADRLKTAVEALEASFIETYQGDAAISDLWGKIVAENQTTAGYWSKAAEAQIAGNEENINRFKDAADSARYGADQLSEAIEPLQNAIKAAKQGNQPLSEIWHQSAEQHQISAMHYLKAAESEALGTYIPSNQYSRLDKAAYDASCSAKQFKTAAEGYPSKNEQEYIQSKQAAKIYESGDKEKYAHLEKTAGITYFLSEASRCLGEVIKRKTSGNRENLSKWHRCAEYNKAAADSMKSSLDRLEKASEASKMGNLPLSTLWKKTAEQYQSAAEYYRKSAEGYETDCKEDNRRGGRKEGWQEGQRFGGDWEGLDSKFEFNSGCGRRALQGSFQLEKAVECTEKAISAAKEENQTLSDLWHEATEQYEVAADYSSKHAEALASSWHFTGDEKANQLMCQADAAWKIAQQLEYAAMALEKAIQAEKNDNQPLANLWRKAVEQNQVAVEYGRKHAETFALKSAKASVSKKEKPRFYETRDAAASSAKRLNQAAIAFDKSCQAEKSGNQTLANLWRKSFEQNQLAVECHKRDVEAFQGQGSFSVKRGVNYIESRADQFRDAAISLEQAIKAEESNDRPLAALWLKSSEQWQAASEYMGQALEFYEQGSHDYCNNVLGSEAWSLQCDKAGEFLPKANHFDHIGRSAWSSALQFKKAAELLEKAIEAEKQGNPFISALYRKASSFSQTAAEYKIKDKEAYLQGSDQVDYNKKTCFYYAAESVENSADQLEEAATLLEKAIKAEKTDNQSISTLYRRAADLNQVAAEYSKKASDAYVQKNKTEGENLDRTAKSSKQNADEAKREADLIFFVNDLSDKEDSQKD